MSHRRLFLQQSLTAAAALLLSPNLLAQPSKRLRHFGFITSIIRDEIEQDWRQALAAAAAAAGVILRP